MDMQTAENADIKAGNFTVAALQRKIFRRSGISVFVVNKQLTGARSDSSFPGNSFNRVVGAEYNLASADNKWTGKAFYHQSFYPGSTGKAAAAAANITYSNQHFTATLNQSRVGMDYLAEVGYIRRKGYYELNPLFQYKFYPSSGRIVNHGPIIKMDLFTDRNMNLADRETQLMYQAEWMNKSLVQVDVKETYMKLLAPFDPTNKGGVPFLQGEDFHWKEFGISYTSDIRKPFNVLLSSRYGGYFTGNRFLVDGQLFFRVQPYGSLSWVTTYNKIDLPSPYNSAKFLLIGPRLDFTFTNTLFFTSLVQYNNQIDNLNLNLRFQWRFAPVSDLYIVYTENAVPGNVQLKNRGLVIKVSYWFN